MDEVTRHITAYCENPVGARALVQFLEQRDVKVDQAPADEEKRNLAADLNEVAVALVATGSATAIKAAVKQFREYFRHARYRVEVEDESSSPGPDDGGFLDE